MAGLGSMPPGAMSSRAPSGSGATPGPMPGRSAFNEDGMSGLSGSFLSDVEEQNLPDREIPDVPRSVLAPAPIPPDLRMLRAGRMLGIFAWLLALLLFGLMSFNWTLDLMKRKRGEDHLKIYQTCYTLEEKYNQDKKAIDNHLPRHCKTQFGRYWPECFYGVGFVIHAFVVITALIACFYREPFAFALAYCGAANLSGIAAVAYGMVAVYDYACMSLLLHHSFKWDWAHYIILIGAIGMFVIAIVFWLGARITQQAVEDADPMPPGIRDIDPNTLTAWRNPELAYPRFECHADNYPYNGRDPRFGRHRKPAHEISSRRRLGASMRGFPLRSKRGAGGRQLPNATGGSTSEFPDMDMSETEIPGGTGDASDFSGFDGSGSVAPTTSMTSTSIAVSKPTHTIRSKSAKRKRR